MANDKPTYTFKQLAAQVLGKAAGALTAQEIWQEAVSLGLDKQLKSVGKDRCLAARSGCRHQRPPRLPDAVVQGPGWVQSQRQVYWAFVQYTYRIDGQMLDGLRIHCEDDAMTDWAAAQRTIDKYPPKRELMVLYDPKDPNTAYLETRTSIGGVILCAFGGFWIALGGLLVGLSFL